MLRTQTLAKICRAYKHTQANMCDAQKDDEGKTLWNSLESILRQELNKDLVSLENGAGT